MTKIVHATTRGQITLPKKWREAHGTDYFEITMEKENLILRPLKTKNSLAQKVENSWQEYLAEETIDHAALKKEYGL